MKKFILVISLLISINSYSQKYIAVSPSIFTNAGGFNQTFCPTVEVGKRWDVFSLGLDLGKMNVAHQNIDTTIYLEAKTNLSVFQQGKFSNNLIIGAGYVFNSNTSMLYELTTCIEYAPKKRWAYDIYIGTYYFKGNTYGYNNNFFGTSIIYYLK
jgi:hypothetical protein